MNITLKDRIILDLIHKLEIAEDRANALVEENKKLENIVNAKELKLSYTQEKSDVSQLKIFMDVFNELWGEDSDVNDRRFIYELVKTGKFTEKEAVAQIKKAMQYGQIYERKTGVYAKA
jgi:DNA replicative helicase MCM subunit Mcm2 (Cdc46/Mcm family)